MSQTKLRIVEPLQKPIDEETSTATRNLRSPSLYLNRELTWLEFNRRVLHEALDSANPLLERLKFLSIVASNLDEFFMKRIGGLKQQVGAGIKERTIDGRTPQEQIDQCKELIVAQEALQRETFASIRSELGTHGIHIVDYASLSSSEKKHLRQHYQRNIFPLVTPQASDPAHPFPFISNLALNLLVSVRYRGDAETSIARVKVPIGVDVPRFLRVGERHRFIPVEEVMAHNLDLLFPGMDVESCSVFRVTRNANTERDEEHADDLLALIESELRDRRFAPIVRLEVGADMPQALRGMLAAELGLKEESDVFEVPGLLALRDLMQIWKLDLPDLHDPVHSAVDHPKLTTSRNIFHTIRDSGPILLQHPYESFTTSVERFLREAARDPKVRAIKMTLYRTSPDSQILDYLCEAAQNGKQVAVVVELKARFDEAANIQFASRLEESGIHVTYGVVGLKTHSKVILVVRQDYNGLRRYAHIGTGNYHAGTARIYSDLGILTGDEEIGADLTELFNYLTTGYKPKRAYRKLIPAPTYLKKALLAKIQREIDLQNAGRRGMIQFKMNALEDSDITKALYKASQAGVRVDLIVRDTCRLRPGIPGVSDNVRVVSIVGKFLEHSRVFYFRNDGNEEYWIGSADSMKRNLESRVEVVAPVDDPSLQEGLRTLIDVQLRPEGDGWWMDSDGSYTRRWARGQQHCQDVMIEIAEKRQTQANRLRKRRSQNPRRKKRNKAV